MKEQLHLGTPHYHRQLDDPNGEPEFAVTRFRGRPTTPGEPPVKAATDALWVWVSLAPTGGSTAFATTVLDLRRAAQMQISAAVDSLHYYLAGSLLRRVALENEVSTRYELQQSRFGVDLVVAQLTRSILSERLALDEVATLLGAHILQRYCDCAHGPAPSRRGLRTWQKIRVEELLRAHLTGDISHAALAKACALSQRQFSRSFRDSFGVSARQYLIRLRLERARTLLARTNQSLAEVAQLCGFCDQSALTRAFSRVERTTPLRWRKHHG